MAMQLNDNIVQDLTPWLDIGVVHFAVYLQLGEVMAHMEHILLP